MSFSFDADTKEQVRTATDIVDLIGSRYELRRQGRMFTTLCPWHKDTRPSLQINQDRQTWKCWVCDIGGDVFNFLMQDEGISFPEALRKLAERAGIVLKSKERGGSNRSLVGNKDIKQEIYRALAFADEFYHRYLLESDAGAKAREYLEQRQITAESIKTFGIGLSPKSWSAILDGAQKEKISAYALEAAGLAKKRDRGGHYDFFRDRLMFPVRDREKRVIAFGGRILPGSDEGAKYINSPETRVFKKSQQLYGFDLASQPIRHSKQAIVVEGYTDVIIAQQSGVETAVAVLGTALGQAHLKFLQRNRCESVVLLLDGDEAGQRRSDDVLELFLHAQMDVRVLTLPQGQDPADFLLAEGADALNKAIDRAGDALEFKMQRVTKGFDPLRDTHRANQAVEEMLSLLAKVPHSGLISNESFRLRQNQVLPRLARQFSIPEESLREQLTALRKKNERFAQRRRPQEEEPKQKLMRPGDLSPYERELLELIIVAPQVAPIALERVQSGWLECDAAQAMLDAYQQLEFGGQSLEFESVLVALEDPSLKSLLVTLYEQAQEKLSRTKVSAEHRLRVLTHRMGEQQDALRRQRQVTELQQQSLSDKEELDVLQDVIRQARLRQGLVDPEASAQPEPLPKDGTQDSTSVASDVPTTEQSPPG
ncbi:MAG: DNA primase [Planctomycetota bacterium]